MIADVERCDVCGIWTRDPHTPHHAACPNHTTPNSVDCGCDHIVCPGCCWDCESTVKTSPPLSMMEAKARALLLAAGMAAAAVGAVAVLAAWRWPR